MLRVNGLLYKAALGPSGGEIRVYRLDHNWPMRIWIGHELTLENGGIITDASVFTPEEIEQGIGLKVFGL